MSKMDRNKKKWEVSTSQGTTSSKNDTPLPDTNPLYERKLQQARYCAFFVQKEMNECIHRTEFNIIYIAGNR